ncbi:MAG: M48 family metalloprotease [Deltaproteobacteria bacterium]|nr:M48 family metalloprotease [Deltaproteobacteria bacterium]
MLLRLICALLSVSVLSGCGSYLPPKIPYVKPISEDEEVRISREFRRQAKKKLKLVNHLEVERYVNQVGQRILAVMGPQPFDYRFMVVENSQLNAFAVPGGSIYVHTGLMERIRSTDELAGVLGHEIVHVKSRHIARISGPDPTSLLALLGVLLARSGSQAQAAGVLGQALAATRQLSYSRQLEQEADTLGVRYMAEAGYDPRAALSFLKIIDQERVLNPVDIPPYLMTHPLTQERIASVEAATRALTLGRPKEEHPDPIKKVQVILRLERHDSDAVISENERLLGQFPGSAEPMHLLGVAYHYKGRWPEAREHYERARVLNPKSPGIDRDLGRLYTQIGEFRLAHEAFERALSAEPEEPLNYLFLGELFERESSFREAVGAYLRAHNLSPLWAEPPHRLGVVYGKMNRLGDAYYYLGRSHLLLDEDEKAIPDLERALKIFGEGSPRGQVVKEEIEVIKARKR